MDSFSSLYDQDDLDKLLKTKSCDGGNLREANLAEEDLREANIEGADLKEVNLAGANLTGANLYGAYCNAETSLPEGFECSDGKVRVVEDVN